MVAVPHWSGDTYNKDNPPSAGNADFVEWMTLLRPAVVAQLGVAFTSDVQVDAVLLDKVENGVYCIGGQIIAKGAFVFFNSSGVHR